MRPHPRPIPGVEMPESNHLPCAEEGSVGAERCRARHHTELAGTDFAGIGVVDKGVVLAAALLLGAFLCPAVLAQSAVPAAKPATNAANDTKAARRRTPATPGQTAAPTDAEARPRQAKKIDLGRIDPTKIGWDVAMQADLEKDDRKLPNAW